MGTYVYRTRKDETEVPPAAASTQKNADFVLWLRWNPGRLELPQRSRPPRPCRIAYAYINCFTLLHSSPMSIEDRSQLISDSLKSTIYNYCASIQTPKTLVLRKKHTATAIEKMNFEQSKRYPYLSVSRSLP